MRSKVEQLNLMADRRKEIVMEEAPTIDKSKRKPKGQSIIWIWMVNNFIPFKLISNSASEAQSPV